MIRAIATRLSFLLFMAAGLGFLDGASARESESFQVPCDALDCSGGAITSAGFSVFYTCSEPTTVGYSASGDYQHYAGFVPKEYLVISGTWSARNHPFAQSSFLSPGRPNPFKGSTVLSYGVPSSGDVILSVYDVVGREVRILVDGPVDPGIYTATWNGRDDQGHRMSPGVYFSILRTSTGEKFQKVVLIE
jgi:hypothetical protein